jgi:NADH-dependant formate dehydrogenase delta subunit FdsD
MSNSLDSLVRMINQIAANSMGAKDPVAEVAKHLHSFWTPKMCSDLKSSNLTSELNAVAAQALATLKESALKENHEERNRSIPRLP